MQVQAIYRLQGAFLNIFVRTMHGIACLEANDTLPTALGEHLAGLGGCITVPGEGLLLQSYYTHRSTQKYIALLVQRFHAWVCLFGRAVDLTRLESFVVAILLIYRHDSLQRSQGIDKRHLCAFFQCCSLL